jgi:hypothetical protein
VATSAAGQMPLKPFAIQGPDVGCQESADSGRGPRRDKSARRQRPRAGSHPGSAQLREHRDGRVGIPEGLHASKVNWADCTFKTRESPARELCLAQPGRPFASRNGSLIQRAVSQGGGKLKRAKLLELRSCQIVEARILVFPS